MASALKFEDMVHTRVVGSLKSRGQNEEKLFRFRQWTLNVLACYEE
jgi:hypothetical protein